MINQSFSKFKNVFYLRKSTFEFLDDLLVYLNVPKRKTLQEFLANAKEIYSDKYDYSEVEYINTSIKVKIICPVHGAFFKTPQKFLNKKQDCKECKGYKLWSFERFVYEANLFHEGKYKYPKQKWINTKSKYIMTCPIHGEFEQRPVYHAHGKGCSDCNQSKGEREVERFLLNKNIKYEKQKKFPGCKRKRELPFDFWIPFMRTLIEYDGEQHYKERKEGIYKGKFEDIQQRDNIKNEFCKKVGLTLLRIRWDEDINKELSMFFNVLKASN